MTVMITKGKTTALTGLPIDQALFKTENSIKDEAVLTLLAVTIDLCLDFNVEGKEEKRMMCILLFNTLKPLSLLNFIMFVSVEDRQIKTLIDFLSIFENIMASDQFQFELIF